MRVLIVEDKKNMALMLKRALEEKSHSTVLAFDGLDGLAQAQTQEFDAVVLDLMLPGIDGLEVARRLRASRNRVPLLALTAKDTVADIVTALDIGIDDYLTKPFALAEFMARLRAVARRNQFERSARLEVENLVLDPASAIVTRADREVPLTRTEYLLLDYMMRRAGQVLNREAMIDAVWGKDASIEANTLEAFIKHLRAKIDNEHETKLIQTVRGLGYRLQGTLKK